MNKAFKFLIFLILITLNANLNFSQVSQQWISRYNGTNNKTDEARALAVDNLGNIYICGSSERAGSFSDFVTIKYNTLGVQEWVAFYNGPGNGYDYAEAIKIDDEGNVYITGSSPGQSSGVDYATIKYNSSGIEQWTSRYTSSGNNRDAAYALGTDNNENVYVTGESLNISTNEDYLTIKYNSSGVRQWTARYNGLTNGSDKAFAIAVEDSNKIFVTGGSSGDFATIKYNSSGIQQWVVIYNDSFNGEDAANSIGLDSLGNIFVSGNSEDVMQYSDYMTIKYNSSGIEQWTRKYDGSAHFMDQLNSMVADKSGNVYVTGNSTENGNGYDYTTIKYNTNGEQKWIERYNFGLNDIAFALALDNLGSVYVTGESYGNGSGADYATVKYDSLGRQKWVIRYASIGDTNDAGEAIGTDMTGNVYVTGYSGRDIITIKYSQTITNINSVLSGKEFEFKLNQNYPNPYNPDTKLGFVIPDLGFVTLKVYDETGREIKTLVNENKPAGNYEVEFDGSDLSSGIYFYSLTVDGNVMDTKRMVLIK